MLIEELIRLGRPLVEGGLNEQEALEIITDVNDPRARNFLRHVFVAELPLEDDGELGVWSLTLVTDLETTEGEKAARVDVDRAVGCPFSLPTGGNPLNPQGRYGIPVYPCWDPHLRKFRESADGVRAFLYGRLERTPGLELSEELLITLCCRIHEEARRRFGDSDEKRLGVLVLVRCAPDGFYSYGCQSGSATNLGKSQLKSAAFVEPKLPKILDAVWAARLEEGAEMGDCEAGVCTVTGAQGRVVSSYCKAWPWAFPTWTCPVPHGGDTGLLIESVALSADAYRALTMGANVFSRLTKKLRHNIVSEVFSPTADQPAREIAQKRGANDLASIYGAAFVLPVEDRLLAGSLARTFARRTLRRINLRPDGATTADRQLEVVTGFECFVPEGLDGADYRLTLVYFSGEPSRGDIHLRAYIQDVLPSVAARLADLAADTAHMASDLFLIVHLPEKRREYLLRCYGSVPYLLARGYGGSHLWAQLERALHGRQLGLRRITANCAARMASLVPGLPDSRFNLAEEAIYYLCWRDFIQKWNAGRTTAAEEEGMPMRPWRELLHAVEKGPIEELNYQNAAELGFGCGALVRQFSALYWNATKAGDEGKDYLKHRVLTFGADLTPDVVWKSALKQMFEVAKRYEDLRDRFERFYQGRVGVTLTEFDRLQEQVRKNRDEFLTAFWAGYSLQGYDRPKNPKSDPGKKETTNGGES